MIDFAAGFAGVLAPTGGFAAGFGVAVVALAGEVSLSPDSRLSRTSPATAPITLAVLGFSPVLAGVWDGTSFAFAPAGVARALELDAGTAFALATGFCVDGAAFGAEAGVVDGLMAAGADLVAPAGAAFGVEVGVVDDLAAGAAGLLASGAAVEVFGALVGLGAGALGSTDFAILVVPDVFGAVAVLAFGAAF